MTRSPIFWFALGVGAVWGYHHFMSPLPGAKGS
jgi:hypothetical protein